MSSAFPQRCGAPFIVPASFCQLPPNHHGMHAPEPIATAMISLQRMNDELEAERRDFEQERAHMRATWHRCMDRLRTTTIVVGTCSVASFGLGLVAIFHLTNGGA